MEKWLRRPECEKCKMPGLFYRWMDKELGPKQIAEVKKFIARRKRCAGHLEFERDLRKILRKNAVPVRVPARLKKQIRRALSCE